MSKQPIISTFGCRMNTFESNCIRQMLEEIGLVDVILVNSCTITNEGERQVRQTLRKLKKENPDRKLIITGCASQLHQDFFKQMPEVDFVVGNDFKLQKYTYKLIKDCFDGKKSHQEVQDQIVSNIPENDYDNWEIVEKIDERSRAFVPIQTGCNHYCSFCIVPFTRGKFKSFDPKTIIQQIDEFCRNGYNEVVLTGIDITDFGKDVRGKQEVDTLGKLCKEILNRTTLKRLRLSSVDVAEIDDDIVDLVANEPKFMPYFHISMQSGNNQVLRRMRRRHTAEQAFEFCEKMKSLRPEIAFGADIITGFPGETDEEFEGSLNFVKTAPITYVHAFPYSKREKTLASLMDDNVPKKIKKERVNILISAGKENILKMAKKMDNTTQKLIIEHNSVAHTENFMEVKLTDETSKKFSPSEIVELKIKFDGKNLIA